MAPTKSNIVKVQVQHILVVNLSYLDDGLIVQPLIHCDQLICQQVIGFVGVLASHRLQLAGAGPLAAGTIGKWLAMQAGLGAMQPMLHNTSGLEHLARPCATAVLTRAVWLAQCCNLLSPD